MAEVEGEMFGRHTKNEVEGDNTTEEGAVTKNTDADVANMEEERGFFQTTNPMPGAQDGAQHGTEV